MEDEILREADQLCAVSLEHEALETNSLAEEIKVTFLS